jgi:metal-responsive CopG/Arc/MetJ family transcriptional regulator
MRTITVNVSEPVYEDFQRASRRLGRPTSELIREAMEDYRRERLRSRNNRRDFRPRSLGAVLTPLSSEDDLLSEMLRPES